MNFRTQRERKVSLKWIDARGKFHSRTIWIRDIPAFVARRPNITNLEWRDFTRGAKAPWRKVKV